MCAIDIFIFLTASKPGAFGFHFALILRTRNHYSLVLVFPFSLSAFWELLFGNTLRFVLAILRSGNPHGRPFRIFLLLLILNSLRIKLSK